MQHLTEGVVHVGWYDIWNGTTPFESGGSASEPRLIDLIAADGYNTGHGDLQAAEWTAFTRRICDVFALEPGDALFDVGCGAGAFLYPAHDRGIAVGGLDYSESRIDLARRAMPDGDFSVGEALDLDPHPAADVVLAVGLFMYFSSLDYASGVIARMCDKATRAVGILDIPDLELSAEALVERQAAAGGPEAYAERYKGLDHLAYSKSWIADQLTDCGLVDVTIAPQSITGYGNGKFRFNAWGWKPGAR
jgi:SAM-dependent methyltransferase